MKRSPSEDIDFYKVSRFDIILIVIILFLSSFCVACRDNGIINQPQANNVAFIYGENKLLEKVSLKKDALFSILSGKMQIEVKNGKIRVADADCPQHICMHTGWIQSSGQTIVCVPNRVMIEVKSRAPALIDAVAN